MARRKHSVLPLLLLMLGSLAAMAVRANFDRDFDVTWGGDGYHAQTTAKGRQMQLLLDKSSGGSFQSKTQFLFGRFDVRLRLVRGNSAGTVTTFYLSSLGTSHDEIDMEFLGNVTGQPYILHTNIYSQGKGDREEQFYLWFDPTRNFHTYSVVWTPSHIVFMADDAPIRVYSKVAGVTFPETQSMRVYASLWNADDWATRGGLDKTDWSQAPFSATYRLFRYRRCLPVNSVNCSVSAPDQWWNQLGRHGASSGAGALAGNNGVNQAMQKLRWVQNNYRIYSYCHDSARFQGSVPRDCASS